MSDDVRKLLVLGIALGITAALVVWWLERFEERRMMDSLHRELGQYLGRWDEFQAWLGRREGEAQ